MDARSCGVVTWIFEYVLDEISMNHTTRAPQGSVPPSPPLRLASKDEVWRPFLVLDVALLRVALMARALLTLLALRSLAVV